MSDLAMVRGDTVLFDLNIDNADGTPFNLTGAVIRMTAKRHADDPDYRAVFRKGSDTEPETITITNAAQGLAQVAMKPEDTRDVLAPAVLFYDVTVLLGFGVYTPITGLLSITGDATRA